MKTLLPIVAFALVCNACFLSRPHGRSAAAARSAAQNEENDEDGHPPLLAYIPMQRLHETIDGSVQTAPQLDRTRIANALEAIADALDTFVRHDPQAVETIRANVTMLRKPLKTRRQAEVVRQAFDAALVALRTHESGRTFDDIERASGRIENISPTRPLTQQTAALRVALCAVGNAISVRAETGRLRCINPQTEIADSSASAMTSTSSWQASNTPQ